MKYIIRREHGKRKIVSCRASWIGKVGVQPIGKVGNQSGGPDTKHTGHYFTDFVYINPPLVLPFRVQYYSIIEAAHAFHLGAKYRTGLRDLSSL